MEALGTAPPLGTKAEINVTIDDLGAAMGAPTRPQAEGSYPPETDGLPEGNSSHPQPSNQVDDCMKYTQPPSKFNEKKTQIVMLSSSFFCSLFIIQSICFLLLV